MNINKIKKSKTRILFIVSEDWYFVSHRFDLAKRSIEKGYTLALLSRYHKDQSKIRKLGIETYEWSLERNSKNIFKEIQSIYLITKVIKSFRPDLIHAVAFKPVVYSSIGCFFIGFKNRVFALAGLGYVFSSRGIKIKILQAILKYFIKVMLNGHNTRLILQNPDDIKVLLLPKNIEKDKIRLIRGAGVDINKFFYKQLSKGSFKVILPSRMLWSKGIKDFKECSKILFTKTKNIKFILVGKPDMQNPDSVPAELLHKWAESENFEYIGYEKEMVKIFHECSLVCLPTSYGEGLPKSLLEAASCGRPIVTYNVPGCREVVRHGHNGLLIEKRNVNALADAIYTLYKDYKLCVKMGQNGRRIIEKNFTTEIVISKTQKVWEELLTR